MNYVLIHGFDSYVIIWTIHFKQDEVPNIPLSVYQVARPPTGLILISIYHGTFILDFAGIFSYASSSTLHPHQWASE